MSLRSELARNGSRSLAFAWLASICAIEAVCAASGQMRGITTRDLATLKDIKTMSVSPDGRYVVYQVYHADIESNNYHISWHIAQTHPRTDALAAQPRFIADGGGPIFGSAGVAGGGINGEFDGSPVAWSPDSQQFVYTLKKDGEIQLWVSSVDQAGRRQVTHNAADVASVAWPREGWRVYFSVGRKRAELEELQRRKTQQGYLTSADIFAFSIDLPAPPPCQDDNSNEALQRMGYLDSRTCRMTIWAVDLNTGAEALATPEETATYRALTAAEREERERMTTDSHQRRMRISSKNGKRDAWIENVDPEAFKGPLPPLRLAAAIAGKPTRCLVEICRSTYFEGIWWSADERSIIALARRGARRSLTYLYLWRPDAKASTLILQTDDSLRQCHLLAAHLLCIRQTWTNPDTLVSVDLASGRITTLADPNPNFKTIAFTKVEKHSWQDPYGNDALAHLVYPKDYEPGVRYPLIVTTYRSGGFLRGAVGDEQPIHVFAQNGFFVLSFDAPEDEDNMARNELTAAFHARDFAYPLFKQGPGKALDAKLDELERRGLIDPRRVGITAFSYGANIVDTALVHSRRYAAVASAWSPNAPATLQFMPAAQKEMTEILYQGDVYGSGLALWREHSIAFNAERIDVPFLLQVADREYFLSLQNFMALRNAGKPVEMYRFPDEYHVKWQPIHRYVVYNRNVDWFNFWLRGVENSQPLDERQYVRWRELRELQCQTVRASRDYCR